MKRAKSMRPPWARISSSIAATSSGSPRSLLPGTIRRDVATRRHGSIVSQTLAEITSINQRRTFPQGEAVKLVPVLTRITQETVSRAEALALRYEALPSSHPARGELERELNQLILAWAAKVAKLGGEA